jgi:molybdopterin molybdotransferase
MKSIAEALRVMMADLGPLGEEQVALTEAGGRHLSVDIAAAFDSPAFDNSAMDGYAVRADEVAGASKQTPITLQVRGESRAGGAPPAPLQKGTACRIFTGAAMPDHADAVVIQEDTEREGDEVRIFEASPPGQHVRSQGSDLAAGDPMLARGDRLWPGEIGLLASQNISRVRVYRRPTVALVSTGDELRPVGATLEPGTIVNSNSYVLEEMLTQLGVIPVRLPIAPDEPRAIRASLEEALKSDVVISTGGVSVGSYDYMHQAFRDLGVELDFWKVRIKPGKPIAYGRYEGKPVFGLPGNPMSAMITFEVLVAPCLRKMLGDPKPHPQPVRARLRADYRRRAGRVEIARAWLSREGEELWVELHRHQGSGSLSSFVGVNALVVLPADRSELSAGELVETLLWGAGLTEKDSCFEGLE